MTIKLTDVAFMEFARCKDNKEIDFHSTIPAMIKSAVAFCSECPVQQACLNYAIQNHINHGVWGGSTAYQRQRMK